MSLDDIEDIKVNGRYLESTHSHAKFKICVHAVESLVWAAVRRILDFVTGTQMFANNVSDKIEL
ncbi:hypothetical protein EON65_24975 [archaeon]|nr:MAG: hypothetical protein EON65_24975 [archaeon]